MTGRLLNWLTWSGILLKRRAWGSAPQLLNFRPEMNLEVLRHFGASVGKNCQVYPPITLHEGEKDYRNLILGDGCVLNGNNYLDLSACITLEANVSIGPGCIIMTHNGYNKNPFLLEQLSHTVGKKPVLIRQGACIKACALVTMGVTIGRNAVVGGSAMVNRDVPDNCFVAGVPARLVKQLTPREAEEPLEQQ